MTTRTKHNPPNHRHREASPLNRRILIKLGRDTGRNVFIAGSSLCLAVSTECCNGIPHSSPKLSSGSHTSLHRGHLRVLIDDCPTATPLADDFYQQLFLLFLLKSPNPIPERGFL